jgi:peptide/nickel transport system substrate-binding protein
MKAYHRPLPRSLLTRRNVLYGGGLVVVSATASACGVFGTDPDDDGPGGDKGPEAPMLAEQVEAGTLPPVEERLPVEADRLVLDPTERMGVYGGVWRTAVTGPADGPWMHRTVGYEPLMRFNRDWTGTVPNVAKSIEPSPDASEFTVTLRQGMKWSDGQPLTTADVLFAWESVTLNTDLNPAVPATLSRGGEPAEIEALDDLTFVVRFSGPKPLFPYDMARQVDGNRLVAHPRHYLEQFHIDFNPNADEDAQAAGYDNWIAWFLALGTYFNFQWDNPDLPTLNAWTVVDPLSDGTVVLFRRNPYYWKVDPEGSQLPYLDEVRYEVIPEADTMLLRAQNGEFDFHFRHFNNLENKPVLAEAQETGNFQILDMQNTYGSDMMIAFNLNHENDNKREVYQNKDFRVALSHAVNRQRLIDTAWQRAGEAHQVAPIQQSKYYDAEFATQFLEYNVDTANQLLDDAGFDERDGDGYRLGPGGDRIEVVVDVANDALISFWPDAMTLVAEDWEAVGIRTTVNSIPRDAWTANLNDFSYDATVWAGEGGYGDEFVAVNNYLAAGPAGGAYFARRWSNWYDTRGTGPEAEEPPGIVRQQQDLYDQFLSEPDEAARDDIFRQILQIAKEQFWVIGTVRGQPYAIVHNRLHNVGEGLPDASTFDTPAPAAPEQWFIEE